MGYEAACLHVAQVLETPPVGLETMRVADLLRAVPGLGVHRVRYLLKRAGLTRETRVGDGEERKRTHWTDRRRQEALRAFYLTHRQRAVLCERLREGSIPNGSAKALAA